MNAELVREPVEISELQTNKVKVIGSFPFETERFHEKLHMVVRMQKIPSVANYYLIRVSVNTSPKIREVDQLRQEAWAAPLGPEEIAARGYHLHDHGEHITMHSTLYVHENYRRKGLGELLFATRGAIADFVLQSFPEAETITHTVTDSSDRNWSGRIADRNGYTLVDENLYEMTYSRDGEE